MLRPEEHRQALATIEAAPRDRLSSLGTRGIVATGILARAWLGISGAFIGGVISYALTRLVVSGARADLTRETGTGAGKHFR